MYFPRAGDAAKAAYANEAAIDWFSRAVPLLESSERSDVLRRLGEAQQVVGDWAQAETSFRGALEREPAEPVQVRAEAALGYLLSFTQSFPEARSWLERSLDGAERAGDATATVRALEYLGFLFWQQSEYDRSLECSRRQLELAERIGDTVAAGTALETSGLALWHRHDYAPARAAFGGALENARTSGDRRGFVHASNDLAGLLSEQGDFDGALAAVLEGLDAAREIGYEHAAATLVHNAGELLRECGEQQAALACCLYALEIKVRQRHWVGILTTVGNAARAASSAGLDDTAGRLFARAAELGRAIGNPYFLCEYLHHWAELEARAGRHVRAVGLDDEARSVAEACGRLEIERAALLLGLRLRRQQGQLDDAGAAAELERLARGAEGDEQRAEVEYERWRLTGSDRERRRAAQAYAALHERTPKLVYRERHLELTGRPLPEPLPLPAIPGVESDLPVGPLLERIEALLAALPPPPSAPDSVR
jgi:tetratricopeptide (TPR) repeat protein